jgi:uncharacterized protein (TIRG00374 family)
MSRPLDVARRAAGSLAFRAVVTAALMAVVLWRVDWGTISDRVSSGNPGYGLLAVLVVAAALATGGVRWALLLRVASIELRGRELFRIYAVTSFANAFLPTSVGGDVARPLMVARRGPVLTRAIVTVLIDRIVALVALVALAWLGVALAPESTSAGAAGALALVSVGVVLLGIVALIRPPAARRLVPERIAGHVETALDVLRALRGSPQTVAAVLALSLGFQALVTLQLVLLGRMIGADLSFGLAAVALALVTLATLLPVSIGGFGVREGGYVAVLAGGGIGHTDAVLLSLLTVVVLFFAASPGALELIRGGFTPAVPEAQP